MDVKETITDLNAKAKERWKTLAIVSVTIIIIGVLVGVLLPKGASEFQKKESDLKTDIEVIYRSVMSSE